MQFDKAKILVIEDSRALNNMLVHTITSELDIEVESAYSMSEAEALISVPNANFALSLVDLNLPDAPNGEIVDLVIDREIPPIILTGTLDKHTRDVMSSKAIIDYVIKRNANEVQYIIDTIDRLRENSKRKVLVVDDSKSSRLLIRDLLSRHNLVVETASNGKAALERLSQSPDIELIITDFNMPKMDGLELARKVRETHDRHQLSIIGISSAEKSDITAQFLKAGANDFVSRPFTPEEFYCRVNQNIDVIANYKKLKSAASTDFLTGLYNRKHLFETGEILYANAKRDHITLAAAMLDVDHFKNINDTYGHQAGDKVLKQVASTLQEQLRKGDVVGRVGGEEFCALCVEIDEDNAFLLFERLRQAIMNTSVTHEGETIKVTISIGFTMQIGDSLYNMLATADASLYDAKSSGRNVVIQHNP